MAGKRIQPWAIKLQKIWLAMQISHRGKYSVERMIALDEYTRTTSILRVLLVCISTPLPMITFVLSAEMIPLQNPSEGWRANYGIWIRIAIQAGAVAMTAACQVAHIFDRVQFSIYQLVVLFLSVAVCYTSAAVAVAAGIGFPIPFIVVTLSGAFFALLGLCFLIVLGKHKFREVLAQRKNLICFLGFLAAQVTLVLVYPFYQVLFQASSVNTNFELAVLLLLPIIKSVMKNIISFTISRMEDMVPEAVIFTVDFFNAVYLATCLQHATSSITVATIMAIDLLQTGIALHDLYRRTDAILYRLQTIAGIQTANGSVLNAAMSLCHSPEKYKQQKHAFIRLKSCLHHRLSASSSTLVDRLEKLTHRTMPTVIPSNPRRFSTKFKTLFTSSVVVHPTELSPSTSDSEPLSDALSETLRMLFTTECMVLAEYLESVIPVLYAVFMLVMVHLPSAQYHSELDGTDVNNVITQVQSILLYAVLELTSLLTLAVLLNRRAGFQVLHQLAFTLETQQSLVQGKLLLWMLMVMGFRVAHFGADFTFQFKWLHS